MTSPVSIPAGHELVAADFDAYELFTAPWVAYAPVWTANGTAPALGNGTLVGSIIQCGKFVGYRGRLDAGTTTTFGTLTWNFSLPLPFVAPGAVGSAFLSDATGISYPATVALFGSILFISATGGNVTNVNPFTWATGDNLSWTIFYETS